MVSSEVYHRDLKPENVLLDFDIEAENPLLIPVLCDFWAAKIREKIAASLQLN